MQILRGAGVGVITTIISCTIAGVPAQAIVSAPLFVGAIGGAIGGAMTNTSPRRERMVYEAEVEVMGHC